jgi:peptidoglycan/LPS O-acetylase OafA/YrhL
MRADEGLLTVEGWRGLAAFMVLMTHWAPALGGHNPLTAIGFTGVDVFFVISGFVFAPALLGRQPVHLGSYALRRVMRIYPAYLVALGVYVALAAWQGRPLLYLGEHLFMAHVQNREMAFYYAPPLWSLPSELQFYAWVPLATWLLMHLPKWAWAVMGALALVLRMGLLWQADGAAQNTPYVLLHHLPGLLVEFWLGTWAWAQYQRRDWQRAQRLWWAGLGGMLVAACLVAYHLMATGPDGPSWRHGQVGLGVAAGFALVLAATAGVKPVRVWALLCQWAGRLSYGTYLLHMAWLMPMAVWAKSLGPAAAAAMAGCGLLVSAWLLHALVEQPARRWARRASRA